MAQLLALQPEFPASPTSAGCEPDITLLPLDPHFRRTPQSSRKQTLSIISYQLMQP